MANSTVTVKLSLSHASTPQAFGIGETIGAFSVQFTNYGPGILAVGNQSTYTSTANTGNAVLVYPGQVSPVFWSAGATSGGGTSDLCIASLVDVNGDGLEIGAAFTILG